MKVTTSLVTHFDMLEKFGRMRQEFLMQDTTPSPMQAVREREDTKKSITYEAGRPRSTNQSPSSPIIDGVLSHKFEYESGR